MGDVELTPQPTPVFVDDSGRRRRVFRALGWLTSGIALGFLVLVGISLVASPGLLPLSLPGVGSLLPNAAAPKIVATANPTHKKVPAATLLPTPAARSSTRGSTRATPAASATPTRGNGPTAAPTPTPTPSATPTHGNRPTATPTPSASPTTTSHGNPSPHGSPRRTHSSRGN